MYDVMFDFCQGVVVLIESITNNNSEQNNKVQSYVDFDKIVLNHKLLVNSLSDTDEFRLY
jgi:hypothetical protein